MREEYWRNTYKVSIGNPSFQIVMASISTAQHVLTSLGVKAGQWIEKPKYRTYRLT